MSGRAPRAGALVLELHNARGWPIGGVRVAFSQSAVQLSFDGGRQVRLSRDTLRVWLEEPGAPVRNAYVKCASRRSGALVFQVGAGARLVEYIVPAAATGELIAAVRCWSSSAHTTGSAESRPAGMSTAGN